MKKTCDSALDYEAMRLERVGEILLSRWDPKSGGFRLAPDQPATLLDTAHCVLGLEFVGALQRLSEDQEAAIISFLSEDVRPDGSFCDSRSPREDCGTNQYGFNYIQEETTTFCQQALDALLAPPPPPRQWSPVLETPGDLIRYFESLTWENVFEDSHLVMFLLSQVCHDAERHQDPALLEMVDAGIEWLDKQQNLATGIWSGPREMSLGNAIAATFHFTFFYSYRRRPLRHLEQIIDSCLAFQRAHGRFNNQWAGPTYTDYAALDLLAKASLGTDYRSNEIQTAMDRAREALLVSLNPENGGLVERNALSIWSGLLALRLASQRRWLDIQVTEAATFRRLPFLGYHDPLAIQSFQGVVSTAPFAKDQAFEPRNTRVLHTDEGLVSVLIPAYNAARFLPATLGCLRAQTYLQWEGIIVNDGSTDDTGRIARRWVRSDPRFRLIEQPNKGLPGARNSALAVARGTFVHCLDADDLLEPDFYEKMIMELTRDPTQTCVGRCGISNARSFKGGGSIITAFNLPTADQLTFESFALANRAQPVRHLFHREILKRTGVFDETLLCGSEDWDLWIRFARMGVEFIRVKDAFAWYRVSPASMTTNYIEYVSCAQRAVSRVTGQDDRCIGSSPVVPCDAHLAAKSIIHFWEANLQRAINRLDEIGLEKLIAWGRKNLPEAFWTRPEQFGYSPGFQWAYDDPRPANSAAETLVRRGNFFLQSVQRYWPELDIKHRRRMLEWLLAEFIFLMEGGNEKRSFISHIRLIASALGWSISLRVPHKSQGTLLLIGVLPWFLRKPIFRWIRGGQSLFRHQISTDVGPGSPSQI
jgi:glycosyltransferase involved in cell wall biosynthesis